MALKLSLDKDKNGVPIIQQSANAIAHVESEGSGGYAAVGPRTKSGDRAYGRYQVMGKNIPVWTKAVTGTAMTPQQFLADSKAQDAVFNAKFGEYVKKYGNVGDAASMWFTGVPFKTALAQGRTDGYSTVEQYVNKFKSYFGKAPDKPLTTADPSFGDPQVAVESNYEEPEETPEMTPMSSLGAGLTDFGQSQQQRIAPPNPLQVNDLTGGVSPTMEQMVNDLVYKQRARNGQV